MQLVTELFSGAFIALISLLDELGNGGFIDHLGKNDIGDATVRKKNGVKVGFGSGYDFVGNVIAFLLFFRGQKSDQEQLRQEKDQQV